MIDKLDKLKCIAVVLGALLYFISPLDLIPDWIPVVGYLDDLAILLAAVPSAIKLYVWLAGKPDADEAAKAAAKATPSPASMPPQA